MSITLLHFIDRQLESNKDIGTQTFLFLPAGLAVGVQHKDGGLWMHRTIIGHGSDDHYGRSYRIKMG